MDLSKIDWAVVAATLVGPIIAVIITLWYQQRSEYRRSRMELYAVLMRWRRHPTATDFVGALNLIPVYFHKHQKVLDRYAELMALFEDNGWQNPEMQPRLHEKTYTTVAYLLSAMSAALNIRIDQLQILRGGYAPQGWANEQQASFDMRLKTLDVLSGRRAIRVELLSTENDRDQKSSKTP